MNIFISYTSKDAALYDLIKRKLNGQKFYLPEKKKELAWYSSIFTRNERKIRACDMGIVLFSPRGKGSYVVQQEAAFMNMIRKDHFILDSNGGEYTLTSRLFENEFRAPANESLPNDTRRLKSILEKISPAIQHEPHKMIFHTSMVFD